MTQSLLRECREALSKHSRHVMPSGLNYFVHDCPLCALVKRLEAAIAQAEAPKNAETQIAESASLGGTSGHVPAKSAVSAPAPDGLPPYPTVYKWTDWLEKEHESVLKKDYDALRKVAEGLARRVAEAELDARRYRWLREHEGGKVFWPSVWLSGKATMPLQAFYLDEAIDGQIGAGAGKA